MDDDREQSVQRNQLIGLVLMVGLTILWFHYFLPSQPPVKEPPPVAAPQTAAERLPAEAPESTDAAASAWPFLPPVPEDIGPDDEIALESPDMRLVFTRIGGRLKQAEVILNAEGDDVVRLVPTSPGLSDVEAVYPFGLRFPAQPALGDELDRRRFEAAVAPSGREVTFTLELPGAARVVKRFALTDTPYLIDAEVSYENIESQPRLLGRDDLPAFIFNWGPDISSPDRDKGVGQSFVWHTAGGNEFLRTDKVRPGTPAKLVSDVEWMGVKSAYFVVAMKPESGPGRAWSDGVKDDFRFGFAAPRTELAPGDKDARSYKVYLGPSKLQALAGAWDGLDTAPRFFDWEFMDVFAKILLRLLNFFHGIIPNYGIAIILLTIVVRLVMFPLTLKSMRSMKKMQLLAPEMEQIKLKYKDEPQEQQKKIMEMYRERGVNPMGGCMPMLLQMPIFIALYRMLWSTYELRRAPFTLLTLGEYSWIQDLSLPDRLLHTPYLTVIPFVGHHLEYFNLLPILMALSMVLSTKIAPQTGPSTNPQQKMMMTLMPLMFGVFCYKVAAGLNLYIFVSTVLGMVQQSLLRVTKDEGKAPEKASKTPRKRMHFYTAARKRKQRMKKEEKAPGKPGPYTKKSGDKSADGRH